MKRKIIFGILIIISVFLVIVVLSNKKNGTNELFEKNRTERYDQPNIIEEIIKGNVSPKLYERINIIGENWEYDPSVEYSDDNTGWLAYSSAEEIKAGLVETYLAKTNDEGKTWTKVNKINEARDVVLQEKSGLFSKALKETQARLRHETPTLLYDPYDPDPEKRWKMFWIAGYLKLPSELGDYNKNTIWQYAQVFYKYAGSPDQLAEAKEIRLFGSKWLNNCFSEICRVKSNLNQLHPDLADTTFYMEPGSLVKDGIIYLTFTAASIKRLQRTILISSKDHGETWYYTGELTNKDTLGKDVDKNYTPEQLLLTSSALAEENGRQFLLVSPRNRGGQGRYNGVYIFEFDDITRGKLKRNNEGKLVVHKYLPAISSEWVGGGQSEYHEKNTYGGIIMAQTDNSKSGQKEFFKVYNTREKITD